MKVLGYVLVFNNVELRRIMRIAAEIPGPSLLFCVQLAQRCSVVSPVSFKITLDVCDQEATEQLRQMARKETCSS